MGSILGLMKNHPYISALVIYLTVISLISVIVCISDKIRSKHKGRRRVPERDLLTLSALGGSVAMLITMVLIRHKTRKPKFMVGIPAIIIVQYFILWLVFEIR